MKMHLLWVFQILKKQKKKTRQSDIPLKMVMAAFSTGKRIFVILRLVWSHREF